MQKSIRSTHEYFNQSKTQSRINNINIVKQSNLIQDNKLLCSWCELMGASGLETLSLLEKENLLKPKGFIGIDLDTNLINNFKEKRPDLQWFDQDIFDIIPKLEDVGVLNLDTYGNVGNKKCSFDLRLIKTLITKSIKKYGEFILFYNKCLDGVVRRGYNPGDELRRHTNEMCNVFNEYLPGRKFNSFDILPEDSEKIVEDRSFIGQVGAYEIYRGKERGQRMCCFRAIFR